MTSPVGTRGSIAQQNVNGIDMQHLTDLDERITKLEKRMNCFAIGDVWGNRIISMGKFCAVITIITGVIGMAYLLNLHMFILELLRRLV